MSSNEMFSISVRALFAGIIIALATPTPVIGQEHKVIGQEHKKNEHRRYKLLDLGTFGGPTSYISNGFDGILTNRGTVVGGADTSTLDAFPSFCFNPDCFASHAFRSRHGVLTDLGVLPGGNNSQALWISPNGQIAGVSQNGQIDPLIPGFPEFRAVYWGEDGGIVDLGTLGGGYESLATSVNNSGQVAGLVLNKVADPFCLFIPGLCTTQTRAFLWQKGVMLDLGTLGGPDAIAALINEHGDIAGQSFTNSTPNPVTHVPTMDPFLWKNGELIDLGTLGGASGFPTSLNNSGDVVGRSNLAGDQTFHPFLWTQRRGLQDLGTLGGRTGTTEWINENGEVVGKADLPGPVPQNHDATLWKNGVITDLGTVPGDSCSLAFSVNSRGQIVGTSENRANCLIPTGEHAFLWEDGGPMVDLNTLIPQNSSLQLTFAVAINDGGEIAGFGVPPGCAPRDYDKCGHAYVLVPCREDDEDNTECASGRR